MEQKVKNIEQATAYTPAWGEALPIPGATGPCIGPVSL